jgi:hypothetical protein
MNNFLKLGLPFAGIMAFAAPASAVSIVEDKCVSVSDSAGCLYDGNIAPSTVDETEADYNLYNDAVVSAQPDIDLRYLGQSDEGFGTVEFGDDSSSFGTWSTPGYLVDFIAVKAGDNFVLYKLATAASSGTWDTLNIPFRRNPMELSHIAFFGGVPEPATWAMMIAGFGLVGASLRRRNSGLARLSA